MNGEWITDNIITVGQSLLKKDHPHNIGGLQPTVLSENFQFDREMILFRFQMCLGHTGSLFQTLGAQLELLLFMINCALSADTKRQIAAILFLTDYKKITVNFVNVQIQDNGSDCGIYSLAFATSLCCGDDPSKIHFVSHKLRKHLLNCLENQKMTLFPQHILQKKRQISASYVF